MFGVLQTFPWQLWVSTFSILIALALVYYIYFKREYSLDKVSFHTFAVFLRQNSILRPSSTAENLLIYSWVVGAMFLCLAYVSVFLSFLAFPPLNPIRDVSQLAKAVRNGDYQCISSPQLNLIHFLTTLIQENLRVLGRDVKTNKLSKDKIFKEFFCENISHNLAVILQKLVVDLLSVGKKYVSEDRFLEVMLAMMGRKDKFAKM